jgi:hypothetical protein
MKSTTMEDKSYARELAMEFAQAVDGAKKELTLLCTDGWAGRIETPCEILKETPKRFLVRLGEDCCLPGRHVKAGRQVYVPKYAVKSARPQQEPEITR